MKIERTLAAVLDDGKTVHLSDAVIMAVKFMISEYGNRGPALITAIKFVRLSYGIGMKDAKDIVDELRNRPHLMD